MNAQILSNATEDTPKRGKNYCRNRNKRARKKLQKIHEESVAANSSTEEPSDIHARYNELLSKFVRVKRTVNIFRGQIERRDSVNKGLREQNDRLRRQVLYLTAKKILSGDLTQKRQPRQYVDPVTTNEEGTTFLRKLVKDKVPGAQEHVALLRSDARERIRRWRQEAQVKENLKSEEPPKPVICRWTGIVRTPLRLPASK
jgi:hypothetical protein